MQSRGLRVAVVVVGVLLIALVSFGGGLAVGFHKARFSYAFGENYERNFMRGPRMMEKKGERSMMPFSRADEENFRNGHGVVGEILSIADNSFVVKDLFGKENAVTVNEKTLVKSGRTTLVSSDLKVGDRVAVIGQPSETGSVDARFIRVLVEPTSR